MFGSSQRAPRAACVAAVVVSIVASVSVDDALGAAPAASVRPGAPRPPSLTFAGSGSATVYWARPGHVGASPITGYVVRPVLGRSEQRATVLRATATHATIRGLENGRSYTFTVAAVNGSGVGPRSAPSAPVRIGTPSPPRAVTATPGNRRATVSWMAPAITNGSSVTGYVVTPQRAGRAGRARVFRSTKRRQLVTGLRAGGRYRFTVRAINRRGTGKSWMPSAPITIQGAPPPVSGGGACPSARPPSTYAGANLTVAQVLEAAYRAGFRTVARLQAVVGIAEAESGLTAATRRWHPEFGCRPASDRIGVRGPAAAWNAGHTRQMHSDRGAWQISSRFWPRYSDAQTDNLASALTAVWEISRHGTDFSPWNTWPDPARALAPPAATVEAFLAKK